MKSVVKQVATLVKDDCAKSSTGSLGALLGSIPEAWNYGLYADYPGAQLPPDGYSGSSFITYMHEETSTQRQRSAETSDVIWHFAIWFKQRGTDLLDFPDRLKYILENKTFTATNDEGKTVGSASKFRLIERTAPEFFEPRNLFLIRASFMSVVRNFIREK